MAEYNNKKDVKKNTGGSCETCEFYDYDEYIDAYYCKVNLDQDDRELYMTAKSFSCPYYRFYDEYKSVQKQI